MLSCLQSIKDDPSFHDMTLHCDGTSFPCSKLILAARSPVFKAMLIEHRDTKEAQEGHVIVEDTTPDAMKVFLQLIYTDMAEDLVEHARYVD